jgi:predicted TIM-barrel fold metal-dependent hydrolase
VDCDVHCAPDSIDALRPYLSAYWQEYIDGAAIRILGMPTAYPPGAPTSASADLRALPRPAVPADYDTLRERLLDLLEPRIAILNCLTLCETHRNPYYTAAIAIALNDWLRAEWLDRDERLRASMVVSTVDPDDAVAEIERLEDDHRFVQLLLPIRTDAPYGNRRYHRIYEAAAERGLVLGLHAWGQTGRAPTPTGLALTYLEDYIGNMQIVQTHVVSLVSEGVFERFPALRVTLSECGFAWLPPLLWRFDKDWRGVWREAPWVKHKPSEYVEHHFRATTAPAHLPRDRSKVRELVQMIGSQWLLYASDFPHDHGNSVEALYDVLDETDSEALFTGNAEALYRL